jgi:tol-pal system protein YbgF
MLMLLLGCVLDRTGQSATERMHQQLRDHDQRVAQLETTSTDLLRRISQMEEVTRSLGQDQLTRLETMESLRTEVASLRGQLDVLQHDFGVTRDAGAGFQTDADSRLGTVEERIQNLENKLGIKAPEAGSKPTPNPEVPVAAPAPAPAPTTPEEVFALIEKNIEGGDTAAARVVAQTFIQDNPKSDRVPEAYYRIAAAWQKEGAYKDAAAAYQLVVDKYKDTSWTPWAMLRQGECFAALGRRDAAEIFWNDVVRSYPKSKAAKEAKTRLAER